PAWVTGQALLAANGAAFPLAPVARSVSSAPTAVSGSPKKPAKAGSGEPTAGPDRKRKHVASGTTGAAAGDPAAVSLSPAASTTHDDGGGGIPGWVIATAAVGVAAAAVWGGWLLYRRRLPT